jgi:hypothetical protein
MRRRDLLFAGLLAPLAAHTSAMHAAAVLRLGLDDAVTRAIATHSPLPPEQRRFTHAGLLVRTATREFVIHATPDAGVVAQDWGEFCGHSRDTALFAAPPGEAARVVARCAAWLGKPFSRRLLWSAPGETYCTRLLAEAIAPEYPWPRMRVLFYPDPVLHPDALAETLPQLGWQPA